MPYTTVCLSTSFTSKILSRLNNMDIEVQKDIKEELELRLLYKGLAEKLTPVEEPSEERRSI
jgi:hypothetical protein